MYTGLADFKKNPVVLDLYAGVWFSGRGYAQNTHGSSSISSTTKKEICIQLKPTYPPIHARVKLLFGVSLALCPAAAAL